MTSQARTIARHDFANGIRSKLLWGAVLLLLVVSLPGYLGVASGLLEKPAQGVRFFPQALKNFVAPIALITAHRAVVGERESGSLRLLFGHPASRRDVLFGKLLGRIGLITAVLLVAALGLGAATVFHYGTLPLLPFLAITAYVVFYGAVWAAIIVGISAASSTRLQAIAGGLVLFMIFGPFQLWSRLGVPMFALLATGRTSLAGIEPLDHSTWPAWYEYAVRVNPMENFVLGRYDAIALVDPSASLWQPALFLFGVGVLAAWATGAIAVGYWRFQRCDVD